MVMIEKSAYIAGGLFNIAERAHNSRLERELIKTARMDGFILNTTLPQRTALKRELPDGNGYDVKGIVADCEVDAASHDYIIVNLDGSDADSGTSVEQGIARGQYLAHQRAKNPEGIHVPKIISYRTDFRTSIEHEVGVNAMLNPEGSTLIYLPCFAVEENSINEYYKELATKITEAILKNLD